MPIFNFTFTAIRVKGRKKEKVTQKFSIRATNQFEATDKAKKQIAGYDRMLYPTFVFNAEKKIQPRWLKEALAGAGPEEM